MLLYDSINLVINGDQLWAVGWATAQEKVEYFALQLLSAAVGLCCARNVPACCLAKRQNCHPRHV